MTEPHIEDGLYWNDGKALYCKGHVDPTVFIAAAKSWGSFVPEQVKHYWIRKVPDTRGEYDMRWVVCKGPARGVGAYTILEDKS